MSDEIPFDELNPRCKAHRGSVVAPECSQCVKAAAWVVERQAARLRACGMCDGSGQRWDPDTHIAVSPLTTCDHATPHAVVVAGILAAEEAQEAARARPRPITPVPSSAAVRARARTQVAASLRKRRGNDHAVTREAVPA